MGWTRQEIRHSAFVRWLFDPGETHGLGSYPLRVFWKAILSGWNDPSAPTVFDADTWDLDGTLVQTEWGNIDLLIRNGDVQVIMVLENKVA